MGPFQLSPQKPRVTAVGDKSVKFLIKRVTNSVLAEKLRGMTF